MTTPIEALRALVEAATKVELEYEPTWIWPSRSMCREFEAAIDQAGEVLAAHDKPGTVVKVTEVNGAAHSSFQESQGDLECLDACTMRDLLPDCARSEVPGYDGTEFGPVGDFRITVEFTPSAK
jgi:hypothetical protein